MASFQTLVEFGRNYVNLDLNSPGFDIGTNSNGPGPDANIVIC